MIHRSGEHLLGRLSILRDDDVSLLALGQLILHLHARGHGCRRRCLGPRIVAVIAAVAVVIGIVLAHAAAIRRSVGDAGNGDLRHILRGGRTAVSECKRHNNHEQQQDYHDDGYIRQPCLHSSTGIVLRTGIEIGELRGDGAAEMVGTTAFALRTCRTRSKRLAIFSLRLLLATRHTLRALALTSLGTL